MSDNEAKAAPTLDGRPDEKVGLIAADEPMKHEGMNWFVLRVASNKESSVRDTLLRKVAIEKMAHLVNRIL
ncbi:MAG: transcription termination/antitermination factor NusG, partial [Phycisphaerae bacterium]